MVKGHRLEAWDHTASHLVMIANCNRDPEKRRRPYELHEFHPFRDPPPRGSGGGGGLRICAKNRSMLLQIIESRRRLG